MENLHNVLGETVPREVLKKDEHLFYPEFEPHRYFSSTAERETNVTVLLPPGYSEEKKYPVLYALHGYFGNEYWLTEPAYNMSRMITNLWAEGLAKEMIVVSPYVYCSKDMPVCMGMNLRNSLNYDNFVNDLVTDLIPFIESRFSVAEGRENRAITGFSMGGRESLFIGFSHPELFGYIGAVCPAPGLTPIKDSPDHPGQMNEEQMRFDEFSPRLLLLSASEGDGVVTKYPTDYHNAMEKNGTKHIWHLMQTAGHDHTAVIPHMYWFLRMIFQHESDMESIK